MEVVTLMEHPQLFYSTPSSPRPDDFDFNFSGHLAAGPTLSAADELFHAGKILPLQPPPPVIPSKPQPQTPSRPRARARARPRRGISRSLSPLRVSEFALLQHQHQHQPNKSSSSSSLWGSRKWRFKDLFLFRSASEGSSGPLRDLYPHHTANISGSSDSFRYATDPGSASSRRTLPHDLIHYPPNICGKLNKKTSLPWSLSLFGCLAPCLS